MIFVRTRAGTFAALGIVLAGGPAAGGCKSLPPWLGGPPRSTTAHEEQAPSGDAFWEGSAVRDVTAGRRSSPHVVGLAFQVYRLDLPIVGDSRHSLKLWNHVDELRADPESVALRSRSGLRIGAFSQSAWPAIRAILDTAKARVHREQVTAPSGLPLTLEMGLIDGGESIFSYTSGGRLVGKTFEAGKKLILVDYAVYSAMGGRIDLQVSFEVRHDRGVSTWERQDGVLRQVPAFDSHVFSDVTAVMALNPGESLLIGPSAEARNGSLLGSRFLGYSRGGRRFEKLIIVTPTFFQRSKVAAG